jgi:hypothetical protein
VQGCVAAVPGGGTVCRAAHAPVCGWGGIASKKLLRNWFTLNPYWGCASHCCSLCLAAPFPFMPARCLPPAPARREPLHSLPPIRYVTESTSRQPLDPDLTWQPRAAGRTGAMPQQRATQGPGMQGGPTGQGDERCEAPSFQAGCCVMNIFRGSHRGATTAPGSLETLLGGQQRRGQRCLVPISQNRPKAPRSRQVNLISIEDAQAAARPRNPRVLEQSDHKGSKMLGRRVLSLSELGGGGLHSGAWSVCRLLHAGASGPPTKVRSTDPGL